MVDGGVCLGDAVLQDVAYTMRATLRDPLAEGCLRQGGLSEAEETKYNQQFQDLIGA